MHKEVERLSSAIEAIRPQLDSITAINEKIVAGEAQLDTLKGQIEIRQKELSDIRAEVENTKATTLRQQVEEIEARRVELSRVLVEIRRAKADLADLQTKLHTEHERWQDLARRSNKLEASLG